MAAFSTLAAIGLASAIGGGLAARKISQRPQREPRPFNYFGRNAPPITAPGPTAPLGEAVAGAPLSVSEAGSEAAVAGAAASRRQRRRASAGQPLGRRPSSMGLLAAPLQPKTLIGL